jgi:hypothetical protein
MDVDFLSSYFPAFGIFLGWPLLAEKFADGHIGDY